MCTIIWKQIYAARLSLLIFRSVIQRSRWLVKGQACSPTLGEGGGYLWYKHLFFNRPKHVEWTLEYKRGSRRGTGGPEWSRKKTHTSEQPQPSVFFRFLSSSSSFFYFFLFIYLFIYFFLLVKIFGKLDPPPPWRKFLDPCLVSFLPLMGDNKTPILFGKGGSRYWFKTLNVKMWYWE